MANTFYFGITHAEVDEIVDITSIEADITNLGDDITEIEGDLSLKADLTYVDEQLALKADMDHSHNDLYYTEIELNTSGAGGQVHQDNVTNKPASYTPSDHSHNDLYYTENEIDTILLGKSDTDHSHEDIYYTENEVDTLLLAKSDTDHSHGDIYYTENEVDTILLGKSDTDHSHDDIYYTESEIDILLAEKANKKYDSTIFTSNTALTTAMFGSLIVVDSTTDVTLDLPTTLSENIGSQIIFAKINTGNLVLKCNTSDSVADSSVGGTVSNTQPDETFATLKIMLVTVSRYLIEGGHGTQTTN